MRWVPGYEDVEGNEAADALAKEGCSSAAPLVTPRTMSLASAKRWWKLQLTQQYDTWTQQYNARPHLRGKLKSEKVWEHKWLKDIDRPVLAVVLAARSGPGNFNAYHIRFGHDDADVACEFCQEDTVPVHPWTCKSNTKRFGARFVEKLLLKSKCCAYLAEKLDWKWATHRPQPEV